MAAGRKASQQEAAASDQGVVSLLWGHSGAVYGLDYGPDQQLLYTSSADGTVRLWSTEFWSKLGGLQVHCACPVLCCADVLCNAMLCSCVVLNSEDYVVLIQLFQELCRSQVLGLKVSIVPVYDIAMIQQHSCKICMHSCAKGDVTERRSRPEG